MFTSPAWQQLPDAHHTVEPRPTHFDLRDRVKQYAPDNGSNAQTRSPKEPAPNPTDAFFGGPSLFAEQVSTRKAAEAARLQKQQSRNGAHQDETPKKPTGHRPSLGELQASASPLAKELIDRIVANGDRIYGEALAGLATTHQELAATIAHAIAEDDRVVGVLAASAKKTFKPPADSRVINERTNEEMQVGHRVAAAKARIDALEAEVALLWAQWESAQGEVDDMQAELAGAEAGGSTAGLQASLAGEVAKIETELAAVLEDVHEEARASEQAFSKKIKGVMSSLLQQYFLED